MFSLDQQCRKRLAPFRERSRRSLGVKQQGLSILELMTGLVIGLMVTIAALGSLVFMQLSASVKESNSHLQHRAETALRTVGEQLRQAGAIELLPTPAGAAVSFSNAFDGFAGTGHTLQGTSGVGTVSAILRVSHQDNTVARDCLGNQPDPAQAGIRVDSRFSVVGGELRCLGASAKAGTQAIIDHVEDFQALYGMRTSSPVGLQFQFLTAEQVGERWTEVQSVVLCLQVIGERRSNAPTDASHVGCQGQILPNDGTVRRVVRSSFSLRNAGS